MPSFFSSGMTPLHCAAISHSVTTKALSATGLADVHFQTKANEKLSCVQMLLSAGASLLSQVPFTTSMSNCELSVMVCSDVGSDSFI